MKSPLPKQQQRLRCVIYTRVSSDSGLEQEFNSLDNQREAGEAYVKSQAHEGWTLVPTLYNDGGFSGGSLERPALKALLADVAAGLIDVIVVYKVDRLTRSLADFARLVDLFDTHGVSFVSVTQAFNTTNSMGRLTLNVLLSFAQFEREVTGERIRDKIAASKKKGLWMGGPVPLGYRVQDRKLLVNETEAEQVRMLFRRYIELRSVPALVEALRAEGFVTRKREIKGGTIKGGVPLTNGPLRAILTNRVYLGELNHKGRTFPGEHAAIIDPAIFEEAQRIQSSNRNHRADVWRASGAILMGRIHDDRGNRMSPSFAVKNGVRYRYYTSSALAQGRKAEAGSVPRVPAPEVEAVVLAELTKRVTAMLQSPDRTQLGPSPLFVGSDADLIAQVVDRIVIQPESIDLHLLDPGQTDGPTIHFIAWQRPDRTRRREIHHPVGAPVSTQLTPIRAEARARLLMAIAKARRWLDQLVSGEFQSTADIAQHNRCSERSVRMTLALAFLAPKLVKAIADGTLPHGVGLSVLADAPMEWAGQWGMLGVELGGF